MKRFGGTWFIWLLVVGFFLFQAWPALKQYGGIGLDLGEPFPLITLEKLDDEHVPVKVGRGGPVVLNVWATWCAPCREELPMLQSLANDWSGQSLKVFIVSEEITAKQRVVAYLQGASISLPAYFLSSGEARKLGGIGVVPTTFIIDGEGRLVSRFNRRVNRQELERELRLLAVEKPRLKQE